MPAALVFIFQLVALLCWLGAAIRTRAGAWASRVDLIALGLLLWFFPAFWDTLEALGS